MVVKGTYSSWLFAEILVHWLSVITLMYPQVVCLHFEHFIGSLLALQSTLVVGILCYHGDGSLHHGRRDCLASTRRQRDAATVSCPGRLVTPSQAPGPAGNWAVQNPPRALSLLEGPGQISTPSHCGVPCRPLPASAPELRQVGGATSSPKLTSRLSSP